MAAFPAKSREVNFVEESKPGCLKRFCHYCSFWALLPNVCIRNQLYNLRVWNFFFQSKFTGSHNIVWKNTGILYSKQKLTQYFACTCSVWMLRENHALAPSCSQGLQTGAQPTHDTCYIQVIPHPRTDQLSKTKNFQVALQISRQGKLRTKKIKQIGKE